MSGLDDFEYFEFEDEVRLGRRKQRVFRTPVPGRCWRFSLNGKTVYIDWCLRLALPFGILALASAFVSWLLLQATSPRITESAVFGLGALLMGFAFLRSVLNRNVLTVYTDHFTILNMHHFKKSVVQFEGTPSVSIQRLIVWTDYARKFTKYEGIAAFVKNGESFFVFCVDESEDRVRDRLRNKLGIEVHEWAAGGTPREFLGLR